MCANVSTFSCLPASACRKVAAFTFCGWCLAPEQQILAEPVVLLPAAVSSHGREQLSLSLFSVQGISSLPKEPLQTQLPRVVRAVPSSGENKPENGTSGKDKTLLIPNQPWLSLGCASPGGQQL